MPRPARTIAAIATATAVATLGLAVGPGARAAGAAGPTAPVVYRPPVDAPVVDRFRPPARPGQAGNLGVDYATAPGTPVRASAPGTVAFAGQVGGRLHVVVLHPDGIRTTYAFLATVAVARGQAVASGAVVGTTGTSVHFGARAAGDAYLDPLVLLAGGALELRLVADGPLEAESEGGERNRLVRFLAGIPKAASAVGVVALEWVGDAALTLNPVPTLDEVRAVASSAVSLARVPVEVVAAVGRWRDQRGDCTPAGTRAPRPQGRRLAVLVSGLASTSDGGGAFTVRTEELGYDDGDVHRFSYRAATTAERSFGAAETQGDIAAAGGRLRAVLEDLQERHPGVPIDVIAHSQGGLVARSALGPAAPPAVETLVTLATPHGGSDLATLGSVVFATLPGSLVKNVVDQFDLAGGVDLGSDSVAQLSETSAFLRRLNAGPLPPGVRVTSVAARFDPVVTSPKARLRGARNVVVDPGGAMQHGALPASDAATREIGLAVAGLPPTCQGFADAMADEATGIGFTAFADAATILAAGAGLPARRGA